MAHQSNRGGRRRKQFDANQFILPFETPDELRGAWNSMDWRLAGFKSEVRFEQGRELVMAIKLCGLHDGCRAHRSKLIAAANRNSQPDKPAIRQRHAKDFGHFHEVLKELVGLGFIECAPNWGRGVRAPSDRIVCEERIAEVVARTRELRCGKKPNLRPTNDGPSTDSRPTNTHLSETSETSESKQSPKTSSTSSIGNATPKLARQQTEVEEDIRAFVAKVRASSVLDAPLQLDAAVRAALAAGCTLEQLRDRARWFARHQHQWKREHRPGALFRGLHDAVPGLAVHKGWPFQPVGR